MSPPPPEPSNEPPPPAHPALDPERVAALQAWGAGLRQLTPWAPVTPVLIAINVVVFVAMAASGVSVMNPSPQTLLNWGANFGPSVTSGEWWRLVSCAFLHSGIPHLAFNMLCLVGVGRGTERMIGSTGFLVMYLTSAVAGSLASVAWSPAVVGVGASGAVFGTFGAFFAATVRARDTIPKPARDVLWATTGKLLGLNLAVGFFVPNVDVAAHVGGLVWGFLCGLLLGHPLTETAARGRKSRNLIAAAAFVPVVAVGFMVASNRVATATGAATELARISADEQKVFDAYNAALLKVQGGAMTDGQFLAVLDDDVLRPWNDLKRRFELIRGDAALNPTVAKTFGEYLALRGEGFALLRKAVATNDEGAAIRSREMMAEADRLVQRLNGGK
jgi:rhomboid protease GluP